MITFAVSDVAVDRSELPTLPAHMWMSRLGFVDADAFALGCEEVVPGHVIHPLGLAVGLAFDAHRPLVITPDAIWLTLAGPRTARRSSRRRPAFAPGPPRGQARDRRPPR